jgi:Txe/YoeB family toxin of Txe-Axe toxin-antitoxin module
MKMKHNIIRSFIKSKLGLFFILLLVIFTLDSCKNEIDSIVRVDTREFKEITYMGFSAKLPTSFPSEVINFSIDDLKKVAFITNKNSKSSSVAKKSLNTIVEEIYAKYPSFDNFDPKAYKKYFPKMTEKEITENSELVQSYMEKLMAYDVSETFSREGDGNFVIKDKRKKNAKVNTLYETVSDALLSCENWYYVAHLRMDSDGIYASRDKAFALSTANQTGNSGANGDKIDALRHGIWGALLGKYACYRYGTVPEASNVAAGFIQSHECGQGGSPILIEALGSRMDQHQNDISILYYMMNSESYNAGFLNRNVRLNKTDSQIVNDINSKTYKKVTSFANLNQAINGTSAQFAAAFENINNSSPNELVHILD